MHYTMYAAVYYMMYIVYNTQHTFYVYSVPVQIHYICNMYHTQYAYIIYSVHCVHVQCILYTVYSILSCMPLCSKHCTEVGYTMCPTPNGKECNGKGACNNENQCFCEIGWDSNTNCVDIDKGSSISFSHAFLFISFLPYFLDREFNQDEYTSSVELISCIYFIIFL